MRLYLASSSPQRIRFLHDLQVRFEAVSPDIDERPESNEKPSAYVSRLALQKALRVAGSGACEKSAVVVGADTTVALDNLVLGKPTDRNEAFEMISALSGRSHKVYSAVSVVSDKGRDVKMQHTNVQFKTLSSQSINTYLDLGEYIGRAGAYAIQGAASRFVCRLDGSYSTVVGMPIDQTVALLREHGVAVPESEQAVSRRFGMKAVECSDWSGFFWY